MWVGTTELLLIGIIVLFLFGAKRLPEIGKGLGETVRELRKFKKGSDSSKDSVNNKNESKKIQNNIEKKVAMKAVENIPGVKKVLDVSNKVQKVKKIIDE